MVKYERNRNASGSRPGEGSSGTAAGSSTVAGSTETVEPLLYPPLNIPEPHVSDKKKAVMNSIMQYRKIIDEARARRFGPDTFRPSHRFQPPNFSAKPGKPKKIVKAAALGAEDEKMDDTDAEEEPAKKDTPAEKNEEDEEKEEAVDTEDEEVPKSDSDIDDYTANAGFDDDDLNFDDIGGDNENDNQVF